MTEHRRSLYQVFTEALVKAFAAAVAAGLVAVIGWGILEIHLIKSQSFRKEQAQRHQLELMFQKLSFDFESVLKQVNENTEVNNKQTKEIASLRENPPEMKKTTPKRSTKKPKATQNFSIPVQRKLDLEPDYQKFFKESTKIPK